jgi:hypothetical protein
LPVLSPSLEERTGVTGTRLWLADRPQDWNNTKRDRVGRVSARRAEHAAQVAQRRRPQCPGAAAHLGLELLPTSELPLALDRSAADLLRETVGVVLRGALVGDGGISGPDDRSSAKGTSKAPKTPRRKK